ncbi:MAG: type II and III secretion system protein [Ignavibacteriota bacterium]|nr:type II and III secretion system protein [Ignavibacterium sp.]MCO6447314.1 type II and III secretion system protein [Ignavibacterium album]MCZ2268327.1 type II and III secretion system protein [Ignavibacteriales bacterium]QKK00805.1 MAG: type II and III secretion system protein [Ignavibacteriota bacterium]HMN18036.1 type II and III secretion system protein [Ignavibacteriaceae bacterium]
MKTILYSLLIVLMFIGNLFPQKYWERRLKDYNNPDELVTMSQSLPFSEAIALLSKVSESTTGKRIVSTVVSDKPIGLEIENLPYDKALFMIVQYNGYIIEEKEDVIVIKRVQQEEVKPEDIYASVDSREIKISAVFFEVDVAETKERGIDWKFLLSQNGLDLGTELNTRTQSQNQSAANPSQFNVSGSGDFNLGDFYGQATAMFRFFENEGLGEIIASPNITVRDKRQGRIQVGSDFSVRTRDFAGNTVEKFFPTGTIIEVTPHVYKEDGIDYILLNIQVERSSFQLNEQTTEIKKTNASTQVLMLNGEETILGGLFVNEETITRNGIPFLKDLPWWVFGIRYLTGSDQTVVRKKELVILLKTELLPTLKERLENPTQNPLNSEVIKQNNRIKYYQMESTSSSFNEKK